ncbi:unnamed protein product [Meloidogyne enterolobii]|uniref:Uncharacterized protein n=2 Tax=Meloidogyne enterolobii TaxID=390850 RepID=A0ACB0XW96_MELEN
MDSAHARVPYRIFFGSKFENFVPTPFKMARCKIGKDGSNCQNLSFQVFLISYVIERPLAVPKRYNMSGVRLSLKKLWPMFANVAKLFWAITFLQIF